MGKTLQYVKEFDFNTAGKTVGMKCGGKAKGTYATGGEVKAAVHKHEKAMHPGKPMTKLAKGGKVKC